MKGDKPPCRVKECMHNELKHAKGGRCMVNNCPCEGYK